MPVAYSSEEGPLSKSRNYKLAVEICVGESLKVKYDSGLEPGFKTKRGRVPNGAKQFGLDTSVKVHFSNAVHNTTMAINLASAVAKR